MASRKEQKEQLRREREEREAAERSAARRKQMVGYAAGAAVVLIALVIGVVLLTRGSGGGDDGMNTSADVLPDGGEIPDQKITDLDEAAQAAGCELESFKGSEDSRRHVQSLDEQVKYSSKPPSIGPHFNPAPADGAYENALDVKEIVHTLEHGRMVIWFKKDLPAGERANFKAFYDDDPYQMVLTPDETRMTYAVAATAWSRDPLPGGTGRLLGCDTYDEKVFDAFRAFKDEYRGNGPEAIP